MGSVFRFVLVAFFCVFLGAFAQRASAQEPTPPSGEVPASPTAAPTLNLNLGVDDDCEGCCPTTTREKMVIGGGSVGLFAVVFVLLRAAMVSALIRKDWSPLLASHAALSATLMVGTTGTTVLAYAVKGCWLTGFALLSSVLFAFWFVHLLFTFVAVRGR